MTIARIICRAQLGLAAPRVDVEIDLGAGLPNFTIVGLAAAAVRESKERVRAALANCGFEFPSGRITVNLAPADLPKEGCRFDLPIAVGILAASGQLVAARSLDTIEIYGELGLGGELKPLRGLLLAGVHAMRAGHALIVPRANAAELALLEGQRFAALDHLTEVCACLAGTGSAPVVHAELRARDTVRPGSRRAALDLRDVRGQAMAKRALSIAAAGGHSTLLIGPPGCGKSMLAQRMPGLLPPLTADEALDVAMLLSVGGREPDAASLAERPFRAPHHTASAHAIVGGGPHAHPGEATLAHHGVLFLDELPEFDRRVLESLREPLETGVIAIVRTANQAEYPARFQLIAAMNPCPCGYAGDISGRCRCGAGQIARYVRRVSGPLLDRIDLRVEMTRVEDELVGHADDIERSAVVAERVAQARARQLHRIGRLNAHLGAGDLGSCALSAAAERMLAAARRRLDLSPRSCHRVMRVARTIADLADAAQVDAAHIAEAVQLRRALEPAPADAPCRNRLPTTLAEN